MYYIIIKYLLFTHPNRAVADIGGLTKCSESPAFAKREKASVKKLEQRMSKYEAIPLFEYCPGTAEFSLVDVSTCPGFRLGQLRMSLPAGTLWPWLDKKPTLAHPFTMACCSVALRFFSLHMSSPSGVW